MRSESNYGLTNRGPSLVTPGEEELETGEPIPDEGDGQPAKIAGMRGNFGGGAPTMPKPTNPNDGQLVLASAKYLKRDPEPELRRERQKRESRERAQQEAANNGGSVEKSILTSGVLGGVLAMLVAVVWFFVGLMNDYIYFYPPVLFVCGLGAVMKGLMGGEQRH